MRKLAFLAFAVLMASCGKEMENTDTRSVQFTFMGDFGNPSFTRAVEITANGSEMTELWVYEIMDGEAVQRVHQTNEDSDFGVPVVDLSVGEHTMVFIVSRGTDAAIAENTLYWSKPSDTFYKRQTINVSSVSQSSYDITLQRAVTRLRISVTDEVPAEAKTIFLKPESWFCGIDITTGQPDEERYEERVITIPSSYAGTSGQLVASIFGFSGTTQWRTDVQVGARDASGNTISSVNIPGAPFLCNRTTNYSGRLFSAGLGMEISLDDDWMDDYTDEW